MTQRLSLYLALALLLHLLLGLSFALHWVLADQDDEQQHFEKQSERYLPSYLYDKNLKPQNKVQDAAASPQSLPTVAPQTQPVDKQALALTPKEQKISAKKSTPSPDKTPAKRIAASSFLEPESLKAGKPQDEPLLKELTRATSAKLYYPEDAAIFGLRGVVTLSFTLYPDGRVTQVQLVKSSGYKSLDEAAQSAIKAISPVRDVNLLLTKPRFLIVGIIYG